MENPVPELYCIRNDRLGLLSHKAVRCSGMVQSPSFSFLSVQLCCNIPKKCRCSAGSAPETLSLTVGSLEQKGGNAPAGNTCSLILFIYHVFGLRSVKCRFDKQEFENRCIAKDLSPEWLIWLQLSPEWDSVANVTLLLYYVWNSPI